MDERSPLPRWVHVVGYLITACLAALMGQQTAKGEQLRPMVPLDQPAALVHPVAVVEDDGTLSIDGPDQLDANRLVRCVAKNLPPKAGVIWRVSPADQVDRGTAARGRLEFTAPPGVYVVELLAVELAADGTTTINEARKVVKIVGIPCPPSPMPPPPPPTPKPTEADPVAATARIVFGTAGCTATVIYPRRPDGRWDVLTAAHCTRDLARGTMILKDGRRIAVSSVRRDAAADTNWLVTDDPVDSLPYAILADQLPAAGVAVWHNGYGVDRPANREDGVCDGVANGGQLRFTLSVSSGDSGGGIFRVDNGQLVACVCCTSGMGRKVAMYGGSCEAAKRTRPTTAAEVEWSPVPIPLVPDPAAPAPAMTQPIGSAADLEPVR